MQTVAYKIIPDPSKNSISFSKNYRIFSTEEPLEKAVSIVGFDDDVEIGTGNPDNLIRKVRYSTDRGNWSLWYEVSAGSIGDLSLVELNESPVFFEVKYEYDDLSYDAIVTPIVINSTKIRVTSTFIQPEAFTPPVYCTEERCPTLVAEREASFKPYELGSAIGVAHELSLQTNKLFGHEVVYFKTEPDRDGADFIFKEWTLFKTIERKCIKVVVPDNKFPDNKPNFTEFGVDFEIPFEIHVDHTYFQMIFGKNAQPRKRDYLYFPLVNRMYEIQGCYLFRGFMMEPIYWKIQLTKFHPNIDMLMKAEDRTFLDNIIVSSEQLFGKEAEVQKKDALNKQQYKTISTRFDEVRQSLHPDIRSKVLDLTFNYAPLIEYYYDFSAVQPKLAEYSLFSDSTDASQTLSPSSPHEVFAYQSSEIFKSWRAGVIFTGDSNIGQSGEIVKIKTNGPKDSYSPLGKYVVLEGYKNLGFKPSERRSLVLKNGAPGPDGTIQVKRHEAAVLYKKLASTQNTQNMTFCALVNFNRGTQDITFFRGYDDYESKGLVIAGHIQDSSGTPSLTIYITINGTVNTFSVGEIEYGKWYPMIVPISAQYGQLAVNLYSLFQDPANIKNFSRIVPLYSDYRGIGQFEFDTTSAWCLPGANYLIANVRLFNTMIRDEDHEFVVSQLFVRDESLLEIIDNARPRLNVPFVAINR